MLKLIVRGVFKQRQMTKFVRRILKEKQMLTRIKETKIIGIAQERELGRNQTGALVTTHTICDKVPAVPLAGTLSFLADEFNQVLSSAL